MRISRQITCIPIYWQVSTHGIYKLNCPGRTAEGTGDHVAEMHVSAHRVRVIKIIMNLFFCGSTIAADKAASTSPCITCHQ